ncbi:MAG: hypothetical protein R6U22_07430 [Desulfohalobiaceae bacterium]
MSSDFKQALKEVTDVCKFELWLRFFFVQELEDEKLKINIPDKDLEYMRENYSDLCQLAEDLNQQIITPEKSQEFLINFIGRHLDGKKFASHMIPGVLNSKSFEVEMTAFHIWVQANEQQLEEEYQDFVDWMQSFEAWKRTQEGQDMLQSLGSAQQEHPTTQ